MCQEDIGFFSRADPSRLVGPARAENGDMKEGTESVRYPGIGHRIDRVEERASGWIAVYGVGDQGSRRVFAMACSDVQRRSKD